MSNIIKETNIAIGLLVITKGPDAGTIGIINNLE